MRRRTRLLVALAVVLAVVIAAGVAWVLTRGPATRLGEAVGVLPGTAERVSFTDWAAVRAEVGRGIDAGADEAEVQDFLDRAFDADLIATSGLWEATVTLGSAYGFSPLDVETEVIGQGRDGAVVALRLGEDADPAVIEEKLAGLGYAEPSGGLGAQEIWRGDDDVLGLAGPSLAVLLRNVLVADGWVLASDEPDFLDKAAEVLLDGGESLAHTDGASRLLGALGEDEPTNAVLWPTDFVCEDLAMAQADDSEIPVVEQLVEEAGGVGPLAGMAVARYAPRDLVAALAYESDDRAARDSSARLALAQADAVGKGGSWAERFAATADRDGDVVRLQLRPRRTADGVLTEVTRGPVSFATC